MTSKHSPLSQLKNQADKIAALLKAAERGDKTNANVKKLADARDKESVKVGIVMDDKVITLEMPWKVIEGVTELELAEYILDKMRETRTQVQ
jgi:hypothetical protein